MKDREMLELAAKAAGFNFRWFKVKQWKNMKGKIGPYRYCTGTVDVYGSHHTKPWNPLTDDGDALRLAVTLGFVIDRNPAGTIIYAGLWDSPKWEGVDVENGDYIAATRRAITSAAAEIGKGMK